jgi:hypothetical protein
MFKLEVNWYICLLTFFRTLKTIKIYLIGWSVLFLFVKCLNIIYMTFKQTESFSSNLHRKNLSVTDKIMIILFITNLRYFYPYR